MADALSSRDTKLIQYLNEAYGKEKELETALAGAHQDGRRPHAYKKRLAGAPEGDQGAGARSRAAHQAARRQGRARPLPGPTPAARSAARRVQGASPLAKGPLHALRGTGEAEKLLKNAKTELCNEYEEIGNYIAIETLAEASATRTPPSSRASIRREEERMAAFLEKLIPQLAKAVAKEEIPAAERRPAAPSTRRRSTRSRAASGSRSRRPGRRHGARRRRAAASRRRHGARRRRQPAEPRPQRPRTDHELERGRNPDGRDA